MKKIIILAMLACIAVTGNAQFGLGKIKDKIKDSGKKDEKSSGNNSSSSTSSTTTSSSGNSSSASANKGPQLYETDGVTSELHKKYMNQVVFAPSFDDITKGQEKEATFMKNYKLGDPLYYRAYTDNSIANYAKLNNMNTFHLSWKFRLYLDGTLLGVVNSVKQTGAEEQQKWTTFKSALIVNNLKEFRDGATTDGMTYIITKNYDKFTVGKHVLKFELYPVSETSSPSDMPTVCTGELNLEVPATLTNTSLCLLEKAAISDPKTEAELLKAANKNNGTNGVKVTKVILLEDWKEIRGETFGTILRKEINAINVGTEENGKKCFYQSVLYAKNMYPAKGEDPNYIKDLGTGKSMPCSCSTK